MSTQEMNKYVMTVYTECGNKTLTYILTVPGHCEESARRKLIYRFVKDEVNIRRIVVNGVRKCPS